MDDRQQFVPVAIFIVSATMIGCGGANSASDHAGISPEAAVRVLVYTDLRENAPDDGRAVMFIDDSKEVTDAVSAAFKPLGSDVASTKYMHFGSRPVDTRSKKAGTHLWIEDLVPDGKDRFCCYGSAGYGNVGAVVYKYVLVRESGRWRILEKHLVGMA